MKDSLLSSPAHAGVFRHPGSGLEKLLGTAEKLHFTVLKADCQLRRGTRAILQELGKSLHFPEWYGANFDALHDCLSDPEWQPAKGHVIILAGLDGLRVAHPADFSTLIEVLRSATEARRDSGSPLWIVVESASHDIPDLPGA